MDGGPNSDHEFVILANALNFCAVSGAARVNGESFNGDLTFRGGGKNRTEKPLVALASSAREYLLGGLEFFLGLLFLKTVDVQFSILHILNDGVPRERSPGGVAQAT